jgi:hypothetical protein
VEQVVSRGRLREPFVRRLEARPAAFDALLAVTGDGAPAWSLLHPAALAAFFLPSRR